MTIITASRKSSFEEVVAEMDRRGDVIDKLEAELLKATPFSTYPEDRAKLLALAGKIAATSSDDEDFTAAAEELAEMVRAILTDEAYCIAVAGVTQILATTVEITRPQVKDLEWTGSASYSPIGDYSIDKDFDEAMENTPWVVWFSDDNLGHYPTLTEAKTAAQSDYERRVLSSLAA